MYVYEIMAKANRSKQLSTDHFKATYAPVFIGWVCGFSSDHRHTDTLSIDFRDNQQQYYFNINSFNKCNIVFIPSNT